MYKIEKTGSVFSIDNFPWDEGGVRPKTSVTVGYDSEGYSVRFVSYEPSLRAVETEHNTDVYKDSCVEFFASFSPVFDGRYINFEINPNGAAYVSVRHSRDDFYTVEVEDIISLGIKARIFEGGWEVIYRIPTKFIKKYIPSYEHGEGSVIRANFYKCGDETDHVHYGCFNLIQTPTPNFHCPEFFAEFKLS